MNIHKLGAHLAECKKSSDSPTAGFQEMAGDVGNLNRVVVAVLAIVAGILAISGTVEWRLSQIVPGIDVGTSVQEAADQLSLAPPCSQVEAGPTPIVRDVNVGAGFKEGSCCLQVALL